VRREKGVVEEREAARGEKRYERGYRDETIRNRTQD
jgi:hypothetical protein